MAEPVVRLIVVRFGRQGEVDAKQRDVHVGNGRTHAVSARAGGHGHGLTDSAHGHAVGPIARGMRVLSSGHAD